jgi:hypothetical protein
LAAPRPLNGKALASRSYLGMERGRSAKKILTWVVGLLSLSILLLLVALELVVRLRPQWLLFDGWDLPGGKDGKAALPLDRSSR